ncbi:MAG: histidine--tRNA ligase, partial [Moraxellaceae bacterium]|nr:histidine--tRNA ligase [Pseudobdellovibrionaceae bacterium]
FVTTDLGAQGAILAGGRYDGLSEPLGGPKTPGVGWASGVDRLSDLTIEAGTVIPVAVKPMAIIALGDQAMIKAMQIASQLRNKNISCEVLMTGNFKKKFEKANKMGVEKALLIFEQDDGAMEFKIKDFKTGEEKVVSEAEALGLS